MINGKKYVGQTRQTIKARWTAHRRASRQIDPKLVFSRAIKKHGYDSFKLEELASTDSEEHAHELERFWISYFQTTDRKLGYNLTFGGQGARQTEDVIARIGEASRKLWSDPEFKKKCLNSRKPGMTAGEKNGMFGVHGTDHHFFGKKHTEETKDKISDTRKKLFSDPSFKQRMAEANTGKSHTAEGRANISKGLLGNQYRKGIPHSEEVKLRIRESLKRTFAAKKEKQNAGFLPIVSDTPLQKTQLEMNVPANLPNN